MSEQALLQFNSVQVSRDHSPLFELPSWQVTSGSLWHIVGDNGAGKTTLLKLCAGLYGQYTGQVEMASACKVLYLGHRHGLNLELSGKENLRWLNRLYGSDDYDETRLLDELAKCCQALSLGELDQVNSLIERPVATLSQGQKKKVSLARLPLTPAKLWLLDEPFVALDIMSVQWLKEQIQIHQQQGGAVVFTHHANHQVEDLHANCLQL